MDKLTQSKALTKEQVTRCLEKSYNVGENSHLATKENYFDDVVYQSSEELPQTYCHYIDYETNEIVYLKKLQGVNYEIINIVEVKK